MAWSAVPTIYLSAYSFLEPDMTIPRTCVPSLTAAEADATTGDIRAIMFSILEQVYSVWYALPTADKSAKMTITRSQSINQTTSQVTRSYTYTFVLEPGTFEVVSE